MTPAAQEQDIPSGMLLLLATASGLIVANLYYAQTLVGPISAATGLSASLAGLIVTLTQIGYATGLLLIVPLGDLVENRALIVRALLFTSVALMVAACASNGMVFLAASLAIGLGSVAAQVLVPFAAHLSKEATRGQAVGKVMSGLLLGIMLARPAASLIADQSSWHVVFGAASVLTLCLAGALWRKLPQRMPSSSLSYAGLIGSLWHLFAQTPVLRRRGTYQAGLFGAFSLFWTVTPMMLAGPQFHLSQTGIAIFALVGMAGAVVSPLAGRLADAGHTRPATAGALLLAMASFALAMLAPASREVALGSLVASSILLDMAVAMNLVLGQRAIFSLGAATRSRLNAIYIAMFFVGGATGSALGAWVFASYGWQATLWTGMAFAALPFVSWLSESAGRPAAGHGQN